MSSTSSEPQIIAKTASRIDAAVAIGVMVFLVGLPFHLVVKKLIPGPIGTYWKEILLGLMVAAWAIQGIRQRRPLLTGTALDTAVLIYLGLLVARFALDGFSLTAAWGLYASVMYLPLFWLVPMALRRFPERSTQLVLVLIIIGVVVSLGGLIEFALDKPLWPADDLLQLYGSYDAFLYGTNLRRVYFTFDLPTALANTLAMFLPLAFALVLFSSKVQSKILAGAAVVVIAGGIIVTYSRGIWVASAFAILVMVALGFRIRLNSRAWRAMASVLVLIGLTGLVMAVTRPGRPSPSNRGVADLTLTAYQAAPAKRIVTELLRVKPEFGEAKTQVWSLQDSLNSLVDKRTVLLEHPTETGKAEIIYRVDVPAEGALSFAIGLSPEVWAQDYGDGVNFQIFINQTDTNDSGQFIFNRYINPKVNPNDRRWLNFIVDLTPWARQTVDLSFITENGPANDWNFDWAGWADPKIIVIDPAFVQANVSPEENIVIQQIGSILDWAKDQSNQDRLYAWKTALDAWKESPIWGIGLGSTGFAGLRTHPETAFVTESQVLKALTELGLLGILSLGFLWFTIGQVGLAAYHQVSHPARQAILFGVLVSLVVVFVEGWVYQNLEVKQVNAYFWTLVGLLAFLSVRQEK